MFTRNKFIFCLCLNKVHVLDYPCYSALHLTITPDNREYTVVRNRSHTCAPVGHPPAFLKTSIYVTPGRVRVMLTYVALIYGL
jgi:hypothetical protein